MNMKSLKKSLAKACQKVKEMSSKPTSSVSPSISSTSISKSSGYGTSVSTENLYYDDRRTKLVQSLFTSQVKYLASLKNDLELYVRPLAAVLEENNYRGIFQNIEKIYTVTEFIVSNESIVDALFDCRNLISDVYSVYLNGFRRSMQLLDELSMDLNECFDIRKFLSLPIRNCKKIYLILSKLKRYEGENVEILYQSVVSLCLCLAKSEVEVENSSVSSQTSYKKSRKLVNKSKKMLVKKKKTQVNVLPSDFTDYEGNKHYFL